MVEFVTGAYILAGLLFIPTTIFGMTWGVRFLQEARGREYDAAVTLAATGLAQAA